MANNAIASLNWMSGILMRDYERLVPDPPVHGEFYKDLEGLASCREPRLSGVTPQAAYRALLGGRSDY